MSTATSKKRRSVSAELERLEAENDQAREASQAAHAEFSEWEMDRRRRGIMNVQDNPHADAHYQAREAFHVVSDRLLTFRVANAAALLDEAAPDRDAPAGDIADALRHLADCCSNYAAVAEQVRAVTLSTPGLDGSDVLLDERPATLAALARRQLQGIEQKPITPPVSASIETPHGPKYVNDSGLGFVATGH